VYTVRSAVLEVARREVGLSVRHAPTRDVVLVVVLPAMVVPRDVLKLLVMLVLMLMVLVVLKRLAKVHLLQRVVLPCAPVHHMALMPVALVVEHAVLLGRLPPGRSRG
jgi:hypothetical protein